jgi:hypothetical protein
MSGCINLDTSLQLTSSNLGRANESFAGTGIFKQASVAYTALQL